MANLFRYPRGSEWRKWDLHLHGPEDKLNNQYPGSTQDEKWEDFLTQVEATDLSVIGFTNYFSIDGLERATSYRKDGGRLQNVKCIMPNVEFRLPNTNKDNQHINFHVFFSNNVNFEDISAFLARLELFNTRGNGTKLYCRDSDLLEIGYDKATVDFETLTVGLSDAFQRDDYLIAAVCNGFGSLRLAEGQSETGGRTGLVVQELDKLSDLFFGKSENRDYYLKDDRYEGCIPRPVVLGSDSHGNLALGGEYTWIKADPTFEGLRQTIFEPELRVQIGDAEPEVKKDYYVIRQFRFSDNSGKNFFSGQKFNLNKNLNAIIGGKSTGKSLLLYYLAKTIDETEVAKRLEVFGDSARKYDFESDPDFDFEVEWSDGTKQRLNESDLKSSRKIVYIPQHFLNRLSESDVSSKQSLNGFILTVLLQNDEAASKYNNHEKFVQKSVKEIESKLSDFFKYQKEAKGQESSLKEEGDEAGVRKYIKKIETEINDLKKKSGLVADELKEYERLSTSGTSIQSEIDQYVFDIEKVREFGVEAYDQLEQIADSLESTNEFLKSTESKKILTDQFSDFPEIRQGIEGKIESSIAEIEVKKNGKDAAIKIIQKDLKPLFSKVKVESELKNLEDQRKSEEEKLTRVKILKDNITKTETRKSSALADILSLYGEIYDAYKTLQDNNEDAGEVVDKVSYRLLYLGLGLTVAW